jgi:flagellar hook-associated protein 2
MGTTSSTSSSMFTGTSAYSQDLQNVITRAENVANLPITLLQTQQTLLTSQSNEVSKTLDGDFTALQNAIQGIQTAMSGSSMNADVSDSSVVSVALSDGATPGNYSIQVNQLGAYSSTLTKTWTGTSSGAADTYKLVIGSKSYNLTPTDNSATSVASAINAQYGNLVQATVVNIGSNSSPKYALSLQSTNLTSDTIDLTDNGTSTASVQNAGSPAQYEVDNSGNLVSSDSRTVNIANGVTVTLLNNSSSAVNITVTQPASALENAISTFVSAYNTAQSDLNSQRGQAGGSLQGTQLVNQLQQVLDGLVTYSASGNGAVNSLRDLGVTLSTNNDGSLQYDQSALSNEASSNPSAVLAFLGSATGGGFLKSATNAMTYLEDPITGLIKTTESDYQTRLSDLNTQISDKQSKVQQMVTNLTNQMNAADAMIATMQQQYTYLSNMLQAEQVNSQSYR